jgi:CelD/BcsL family acetyltransferase involved in cellulose biosynthesis
MTVVVEVRDRIEPLAHDWERLAHGIGAAPFLWPGWFSAWWDAFGTGRLHILTAYEDERVVGILPMFNVRGALSSLTNAETGCFGFLAASEPVAEALSSAVFRGRPRHVYLAAMSPDDVGASVLRKAASTSRYHVSTDSYQAAPYIPTDWSWEDYEGGLRRKFRSELRRRRRRLEDRGEVVLDVSDGREGLEELLEEGFRIEGSGWKESHRTSINTNPALRRFYSDFARWAAERDWLRLAFLRVDGRAIAFDYCFEFNKIHYLQKTGYDPSFGKFAPGVIMRHLMIERAFSAEDIVAYDFLGVGLGSESGAWKREWTDAQQERVSMRMFAPTALGSLDRIISGAGHTGLEAASNLARKAVANERRRRLLRRAYETLHAKLRR